MVTEIFVVQKMEHTDMHPRVIHSTFALCEEEIEFIKGQWDDEDWGRYCKVVNLKRDLRYPCRSGELGWVNGKTN